MEIIKNNFRKYGENFEMIGENDNGFIFKRSCKFQCDYFEVFKKIKWRKNKIFDSKIEYLFAYPSESSFGTWAWCYRNKDEAMTKFINLN